MAGSAATERVALEERWPRRIVALQNQKLPQNKSNFGPKVEHAAMTTIRLSLSKPARRTLKAIGREFDRCARAYSALYHQRMLPWSEKGRGGITLPQWAAFRVAASNRLEAGEWSQWDEPSFDGDHLGLWLGDGEGLDEFVNLSESVAMVLSQEALDFDPFDFNLEVGGWSDWLNRLHDWAFKHQMPLLRSDMTLWGTEDHDSEDFYELAEQWETLDGGTSIPRHPVVWRLIDNVFTSSATAIRALLWPDAVIATNEPWPLSPSASLFRHAISGDGENTSHKSSSVPVSSNAVHYDGLHWRVRYELDEKEGVFSGYEGLYRIVLLLQKPFHFFEFPELSLRPFTENGLDGSGEVEKEAPMQTHRRGIHVGDKADEEWKDSTAKRLRELSQMIGEAEARGAAQEAAALKQEREKLKRYRRKYLNKFGESRRDADEWEQDRKTVTKSISETRRRISDQMPVFGAHLTKFIHTDRGVIYEPPLPTVEWDITIARRSI